MKLIRKEWLQLVILIVPIALAALLWNRLPEQLAIHWDARGRVNGYGSPLFAIGLPTCLNIGLTLLLGFLPLIDPRTRAYNEENRANLQRVGRFFRLVITGFISIVTVMILAYAVGYKANVIVLMTFCMGAMFVLLGNGMTKLRPNSFMGIRTKWTQGSLEIWMKTHRLAGRLMVAGGLLLMLLAFVLPSWQLTFFAVMPIVVISTIVPAIYSYFLARG